MFMAAWASCSTTSRPRSIPLSARGSSPAISHRSSMPRPEDVLDACRRAGLKLATAESCTGGMVAAALTDIAGSSDVVERGFVTYSNEAKTELLGVPAALIARDGAVSEAV